jgi:hypothetical protein
VARQIFRAIETTIGLIETENASCIVITALDSIGRGRQLVLSRPAHHRAALLVVTMSSYRHGERSVIAQEPERVRRS